MHQNKIYVQHLWSKAICAVFDTPQQLSDFMKTKGHLGSLDYWPHTTKGIEAMGMNPDAITIEPKYA